MCISAHAAWAPGLGEGAAWISWSGGNLPEDDGSAPEVRFVDALLRRRLGRLSRMALRVAAAVSEGRTSLSTIFSSRHGELSRTVGMLHALAAEEAPSPAAFSLSVHNSAAGIHAIARADRSPATALAAGEETLLWALQDAASRLAADPDAAILLVYADEPLPGEYRAFACAHESAHAIALLLRSGAGLNLAWEENKDVPPSREPLSLALLAHLLGRRERIDWHGERLSVRGHLHV